MPALSGSGRYLASVVDRAGRLSVTLQDLRGGRIVPLPALRRHRPHASPSLSWNGRYLALITQQGQGRLALIHDRRTGRLHPLRLPRGRQPVSLSLAPDASRIAVQVLRDGRFEVLLLELNQLLERDRAPGSPAPGAPATEAPAQPG